MAYVRACAVNDVPTGGMARFRVHGQSVLVFNLGDGFHATTATCSHTFGPLARGKIVDGQRVRCPLHHAEFDIRTGEAVKWACFPPGVQLLNIFRPKKPIKTYATKVENGEVLVDV